MTSPIPVSSNYYSTITDKKHGERRHSCCSFCRDDTDSNQNTLLESQTLSLTPPLENVYYTTDQGQPFSCIYLLNLFLAPDMKRYLKETSISDDVYNLPVHLQRLISEARMELLVSKQDTACKRLLKLKSYIDSVSHHDTESVINILIELVHNEDELTNILGE